MHLRGAFSSRLLMMCMLTRLSCEARLFDQQIKDKLKSEIEPGPSREPPHPASGGAGEGREPMRMGPFGAMLRRDKGLDRENEDEEEAVSEDNRVDSIAIMDLFSASSNLATFLLAVWPCLCQLYRSAETFMLTVTFSDAAADNRRYSTVWVSWITLASVAIVATVVVKRALACPPAPRAGRAGRGGGGVPGSSKKAVSFQTCSPVAVDAGIHRIYRGLPPAMVALPGDGTLGSKVAARWVNHVFATLLAPSADGKFVADCLQRWLDALNCAVKKTLTQDGTLVQFVSIPVMTEPHLSNVFVTNQDSSMIITSDFSIPNLQFRLQVFEPRRSDTPHPVVEAFQLVVTDLSLILTSELVDQTFHIGFSAACHRPSFELLSCSAIGVSTCSLSLCDGIILAVSEAIGLAMVAIPLADLHAEKFANCKTVHTSLNEKTPNSDCDMLDITCIKSYGGNVAFAHPYVTLTMDSPLQVLETWKADEAGERGNEFTWKQTLSLSTEANTKGELLLELWDELDDTLWGSHTFSVAELRHPQKQEHLVQLKSQRSEGLFLEIQFTYRHQQSGHKCLNFVSTSLDKRRLSSLSGQFYDSVKFTYQMQPSRSEDMCENIIWKTCVPNAFLDDIEKRRRGDTPTLLKPERSTMTIRSIHEHETRRWFESNHSNTVCTRKESVKKCDDKPTAASDCDNQSDDTGSTCSDNSLEVEKDLTCWRGKVSKSWESINSAHLSLPQGMGADDTSSLSEVSAVSSCSAHVSGPSGESAVVLEVQEQGLTRHYLIPKTLLKKNRIKRKGLKLHIASEHVFVAKHIKSSETCAVCFRKIGKRLGKQGYVCRDCDLICHKNCHAKVDLICPKSSLSQMELLRGKYRLQCKSVQRNLPRSSRNFFPFY